MSFNIYAIDEPTDDCESPALNEDTRVEQGLSSGEVRQALLDRVRQELQTGDDYFLNLSLEGFGLQFDPEELATEDGRSYALKQVEDILYAKADDEISCTLWDFHNETVYVRDENHHED